MVDKGVYLYPDVLRVPWILKMPGIAGGKAITETVSLLDLSQTLLDAAGIRPEAKMDGVSLLPLLRGGKLERANRLLFFGGWHVGVNFACGLEHRTTNGRHFVYAYNASSPCDELYDLDSEDAVNLVGDPAYSAVRVGDDSRAWRSASKGSTLGGLLGGVSHCELRRSAEVQRRHAALYQTELSSSSPSAARISKNKEPLCFRHPSRKRITMRRNGGLTQSTDGPPG